MFGRLIEIFTTSVGIVIGANSGRWGSIMHAGRGISRKACLPSQQRE
jgi:hypothetical protein